MVTSPCDPPIHRGIGRDEPLHFGDSTMAAKKKAAKKATKKVAKKATKKAAKKK
jgi:hypothetical protein